MGGLRWSVDVKLRGRNRMYSSSFPSLRTEKEEATVLFCRSRWTDRERDDERKLRFRFLLLQRVCEKREV